MPKKRDESLIGSVFSYLTVIGLTVGSSVKFDCRCVCGKVISTTKQHLKRGTKSCGCMKSDILSKIHKRHGGASGGSNSPEYHSYSSMITRCLNSKHPNYRNYGAKGVTVCERWQGEEGFLNFLSDMGDRPTGLTLDRIDATGNYEPSNCRWADRSTQGHNKRQSTVGSSKYRGVSHTKSGRWVARIAKDGVLRNLGTYLTEELAYEKYCAASLELYGECPSV